MSRGAERSRRSIFVIRSMSVQRINLFPNPVFAGPLTNAAHWGDANGTVRDNALHITGTNGGYGFNVAVPFNVPLLLSMRVDASDDNVAGFILVQTTDQASVNHTLSYQKLKQGISDVLCRFTVPSHGFRFEVNPHGIRDVAVSNVLIERADTYDAAVGGGGSGLLQRSGRTVLTLRRVTADDGHEPASGRARCPESLNMEPVGRAGWKRPCDVHKRRRPRRRLRDFSCFQRNEAGRHDLPAPDKRIRSLQEALLSPVGRIVCL